MPHVSCGFWVQAMNLNDASGSLVFYSWPPTGDKTVVTPTGPGLLLWGGLPHVRMARARLVATLGLASIVGVLAYNLAAGSGVSLPEWAILGYGALRLAAAPRLGRRLGRVEAGTHVAYSFPLVLAPLSLFAINAATTTGVGASPLAWYIRWLLVFPMGALLGLGGIAATLLGETVRLGTPRGPLFRLWNVAFRALVLRRFEGRRAPPPPA